MLIKIYSDSIRWFNFLYISEIKLKMRLIFLFIGLCKSSSIIRHRHPVIKILEGKSHDKPREYVTQKIFTGRISHHEAPRLHLTDIVCVIDKIFQLLTTESIVRVCEKWQYGLVWCRLQ